MRCRAAQKFLSAGLDGESEASRARMARAHLAACRRCQRFAEGLIAGARALDSLTVPEPRAGFPNRLMARLPQSQTSHPRPRVWLQALRPFPAAAAVLAMASGVALALAMEVAPRPEPPERQEPVEALYADSFDALPGESAAANYLALLQDAGR